MGLLLSLASSGAHARRHFEHCEVSQDNACKRLRTSSSYYDEDPRLIPSLPDEISLQILARLPRIHYLTVQLVSRSWKGAITSPQLFEIRRELGTTEEWVYILAKAAEDKFMWHALDPLSREWQRLPLMPNAVTEEDSKSCLFGVQMWNALGSSIKFVDAVRGWLGRCNASEPMPFCGCSVGSVGGCLYVLGGFSRATTVKCVWRYDPRVNSWEEVSSMTTARAFCKTGLLNNMLYVVGGVCRGRGGIIPLRSAEVFDPRTGVWTQLPSMPFSKAQGLPTAFFAGALNPIATGMASYKGRLYVPQSLYSWPFFVDIGGEVYDPETNSWGDMPSGMGDGWPARQAGTKMSVVVDGELYALDPSSSLDNGKIKMYDRQQDVWKVVIGMVPVHDFIDPECPYLLACFHGKLHVIAKDGNNDTAVLQADLPNNVRSSPSTSSSPPANSIHGNPLLFIEEARDLWKAIAAKNFGPAEIVTCQVLDI